MTLREETQRREAEFLSPYACRSAASREMALRTGVRDTPNLPARSSSRTWVPGSSSKDKISCRST